MLTPVNSHELRSQAAALKAKSETHARHSMIYARFGLSAEAEDYSERADSEAHTASMLYRAAHVLEQSEREQKAA